VIVPHKLQAKVLQELHEVHLGIARTKATARSYAQYLKVYRIEQVITNV